MYQSFNGGEISIGSESLRLAKVGQLPHLLVQQVGEEEEEGESEWRRRRETQHKVSMTVTLSFTLTCTSFPLCSGDGGGV